MAKQEIRKETDWLGNEKQVIYEGGSKVGEIRNEPDRLSGANRYVTYDSRGNKVGEAINEAGFIDILCGEKVFVTRDSSGRKVSETRFENGREVIYQDGVKIGEMKTETGFWGGKKRVLREYSGKEVDLTKRSVREEEESSHSAGDSSSDGHNYNSGSSSFKVSDKKEIRRFKIYRHTNPQAIERAMDTGLYGGVTFVPPTYLCRYKCTRCGHEWDACESGYNFTEDKHTNCMMGCSNGSNLQSFWGFCKIIIGLITGEEPFGYGVIINRKEF